MGTDTRGLFVISWTQTETDGLAAAPLDVLDVGAHWRWTGQAVRLDGAGTRLRLEGAEGAAEMRARAARMVRRLLGEALQAPAAADDRQDPALEPPERGFTLTDGRSAYAATLIDDALTGARLVMFADGMPPPGTDTWVLRQSLGAARQGAAAVPQGGLICFTPGTMLATPAGRARIEDLRPGDRVLTRDGGAQPIVWTGQRRMTGARLHAMPELRPIRFRGDALGQGRPDAELVVSPRHRMLVRSAPARDLFNETEILVSARDLVNGHSITVDHGLRDVTYVHVMLEHHHVVWANGLETESFHPAQADLALIEPAQRADLLALMPELAANPFSYGIEARRALTPPEAAILRHEMA